MGICLISLICFLFLDKTSLFSVIMPKLTGYTEYGVAYTKYQGFLVYFKTDVYKRQVHKELCDS